MSFGCYSRLSMVRSFLMALNGLHVCQKCSIFLSVRRLHTELQQGARFVYSVRAQGSSTSQRYPSHTGTPSLVRPKCRYNDTWNIGARRFSELVSSAPPSTKKHGVLDTLEQTGIVPKQATESEQQHVSAVSLSDDPAVLWDLDGAPDLSPFEEISDEEAVQIHVEPPLPPASVSLRDYVDQSETLQKLITLGVDLSKLERRPNVGSMLLRLDFETDVKDRLLFLKDVGVENSQLGLLITHNPFILTEGLENLKARVAYLKSKSFSDQSVATMVSKAPYLLNFSVERLDNRLCFYQQTLGLSAEKTRNLVSRLPRLLCGSLEPVKENLKVCEQELGFRTNEIQHIVTMVPKVLTTSKKKLTEVFDYIHNTMGIPHRLIVKFPQVLNTKLLRIKERHLFLQYLGRAQYDPSQPNYVSLNHLVSLPDKVFCSEVALATMEDYELFQKTL